MSGVVSAGLGSELDRLLRQTHEQLGAAGRMEANVAIHVAELSPEHVGFGPVRRALPFYPLCAKGAQRLSR